MRLGLIYLLMEDYMLPCLNKKFFGIECPGCGAQRSLSLVLQGEFAEAFMMFPATFTIIPLLAFLMADTFFTIRYSNKIIISLLISSVLLILGNYILKFI